MAVQKKEGIKLIKLIFIADNSLQCSQGSVPDAKNPNSQTQRNLREDCHEQRAFRKQEKVFGRQKSFILN